MGLLGLIYQTICGNAPKQSDNVFVMLIGNWRYAVEQNYAWRSEEVEQN
jgi:hypothetical protein